MVDDIGAREALARNPMRDARDFRVERAPVIVAFARRTFLTIGTDRPFPYPSRRAGLQEVLRAQARQHDGPERCVPHPPPSRSASWSRARVTVPRRELSSPGASRSSLSARRAGGRRARLSVDSLRSRNDVFVRRLTFLKRASRIPRSDPIQPVTGRSGRGRRTTKTL